MPYMAFYVSLLSSLFQLGQSSATRSGHTEYVYPSIHPFIGTSNRCPVSKLTNSASLCILIGLPVARDVRVQSMGNASITLVWTYPPPPVETIAGFKVAFSCSCIAALVISTCILLRI